MFYVSDDEERVAWESETIRVSCENLLKSMKAAKAGTMREIAELIVAWNEVIREESVFYPLVAEIRKTIEKATPASSETEGYLAMQLSLDPTGPLEKPEK